MANRDPTGKSNIYNSTLIIVWALWDIFILLHCVMLKGASSFRSILFTIQMIQPSNKSLKTLPAVLWSFEETIWFQCLEYTNELYYRRV